MSTKKYVSLNKLSMFLDNLKDMFSFKVHSHTLSEIEDLIIDNEVAPSANLVKNSAVNSALELAKDELREEMVGKNTTGEAFTIDGTEVTAAEYAEIFNNYASNIATGKYSHAEGYETIAKGSYSHVEGYGTFANGAAAHAEGYDTKATARYAHAEGASTTASGNNSHAEGNGSISSGHYSHAEGNFTTAAGGYSHAEGNYCQTSTDGTFAHAEGSYSKATKTGAHAEGQYTEANGVFSHVEGSYTFANSMHQHVQGRYNIADNNNVYAHIVGNGDASTRSNAHTLDWNGNAEFAGDIVANGCSSSNTPISLVNVNSLVQSIQEEIGDGFEDVTEDEIRALFN